MGAMPFQETLRSTSRELVNGVVLEIWERCPFCKLRCAAADNLGYQLAKGGSGVGARYSRSLGPPGH
jgi:hypothetical protein